MADTKASAFAAASALTTADGFPVIQGGNNKLATGAQVRTFAAPIISLTQVAPTTDQVVTAGYSAYVVGPYEIVTGTSLEIGAGGCFEIG